MDVLFSLPMFGYFLGPALTSWSTSLNLLFFYMTWSTLVLSQPPIVVHIFGILAIRIVFFLIPSLATLFFDVSLPSLAVGIKHGGRSALPPRDAAALAKLLGLVLLNLVIITAIEGALSFAFILIFNEPVFRTTTTLPLPWAIFKHVLILLTARETLLYYIHRFILHDKSYRWLSKRHQSYAHAKAGAPFSLRLMADHPLPLLFYRFLPLYLAAVLLRPHILTYFFVLLICTLEETIAMSGYTVVPGIIMGGIVQRSAIHYAGKGTSNYGSWGMLDWINGTSKGRDVLEDVKNEAEKHRVKERSSKKIDQGVNAVREGVKTRRSTRKKSSQ
ncbi:sterol desaturase family protein [Trichoderma evansii]